MSARRTIFALSSGALPAAIAIVRISGPSAFAGAAALGAANLKPRTAALRLLHAPHSGDPLDRAMCLAFPGPASATGEDVVELHIHGSRAVATAVLSALAELPEFRMATPGEFTRRGLLNGKLDLPSAEALGDLLAAETEAQRQHALRNAEGGISRLVETWRLRLLRLSAMIEAAIDYADEEDVSGVEAEIAEALQSAASDLANALDAPPAERLRDGFRVVIAGPPNAGKSSLFNALVGREAAIVTPHAGTTRDMIEALIDLDGYPVLLIDTAGDRLASDPVEVIGIERARAAAAAADLTLWMGNPADAPSGAMLLSGKSDIQTPAPKTLAVSTHTSVGLDALRSLIVDQCRSAAPREGRPAWNVRQRALLSECLARVGDATKTDALELQAEELRIALHELDALLGRTGVEEMLDELFGRFCLGK